MKLFLFLPTSTTAYDILSMSTSWFRSNRSPTSVGLRFPFRLTSLRPCTLQFLSPVILLRRGNVLRVSLTTASPCDLLYSSIPSFYHSAFLRPHTNQSELLTFFYFTPCATHPHSL